MTFFGKVAISGATNAASSICWVEDGPWPSPAPRARFIEDRDTGDEDLPIVWVNRWMLAEHLAPEQRADAAWQRQWQQWFGPERAR